VESKWQTILNFSLIDPSCFTKALHYNENDTTLAEVTKVRTSKWKLLLVYKPEVLHFRSSKQAKAHAMKELT
jgi:hypothetical protein